MTRVGGGVLCSPPHHTVLEADPTTVNKSGADPAWKGRRDQETASSKVVSCLGLKCMLYAYSS